MLGEEGVPDSSALSLSHAFFISSLTQTQEKERGERVWRDRLQRCQRQLKAKEDEMSHQSQYFENFKTQLQHKLNLARDREQSLQNRIYALEKQLLDMTVSAATGMASTSPVRITAGTVTQWEDQESLPSMRGEGEGEEERREDMRKQWQPSVGAKREESRDGDEGTVEISKQDSKEAKLQGFILSLQEDLRVLLEREGKGATERRGLMEQLQAAEENSQFLGCKVEEMKAQVNQLKLSENSVIEEVEELKEENRRLRQVLRDANNQTHLPTFLGPGTSSTSCSPSAAPVLKQVHLTSDQGTDQHSSAVPLLHQQATAGSTQSHAGDRSSAKSETLPKNVPLNVFPHLDSTTELGLPSLALTTETLDEFKLGTWCSRGILNLEESPSEESEALREAYRSLGLEDSEMLQESLEDALQDQQLEMMAQEKIGLKLREEAAEEGTEREQRTSEVWHRLQHS